ncbi:MAG: ThiF family adenylyltransferase [Verrucomicrobiota bacterium]|jgi:integrative and conjugative element protein (TIGR02256 family)
MKKKMPLLTPPGDAISPEKLDASKARQFLHYLKAVGAHARFIETRRIGDPLSDVIVFELVVERPQVLAFDIRRVEPLAAVFSARDDMSPDVLSLRPDFPSVPHLNLPPQEFPRSICLYEQPFEQTRLSWTPADFLRRIHHWFAATAKGALHAEDQPLEPLIIASPYRLILPVDFNPNATRTNPRLYTISPVKSGNDIITFRVVPLSKAPSEKTDSVIAAFFCKPQVHGVIQRQPRNLSELNALCMKGDLALATELCATIRGWFLNKPSNDVMEARLILLIYLPKIRHTNGNEETTEVRAFLTFKKVREIGEELGLFAKHGSVSGFLIGQSGPSTEALKNIPVAIMQVHDVLTPKLAALMNGYGLCESPIVAVGLGALGSQVFNNLLRSGYGRWTLIDDDVLLPHNCARHFLGDWAVGRNKAEAMAEIAHAIFNDTTVATPIPANILSPRQHAKQIEQAITDARLLLDMSASVAVGRHLAALDNHPKCLSVFVTPNGNSLALLAEDTNRNTRLDWLEMLHYRAVLNVRALENSFRSPESRIRYGNSCRDLTTQLSQDSIATWAGIASKAVKTVAADSNAALWIYGSDQNGTITLHRQTVDAPIRCRLCDWTILMDSWLLQKLAALRSKRLPNETGGVLLGSFDTHRRICSIIDMIPSPPDSKEWPTSYIRGCEGLAAKVVGVQERTLGQVNYVGEWHSHPEDASTNPSRDDLTAYSWLVGHMDTESLPGIMVIIGDRQQFGLVSTEPSVQNVTVEI